MSETESTEAKPDEAGSPEAALDDSKMSLFDHLNELRYRLRNAGIAFILALVAGLVFQDRIFEVLSRPIREALSESKQAVRFVQIDVSEAFWVYFKLAIVFGILTAAPFIIWEVWKFVAPGLYKKEKRLALVFVGATGMCFSGGALFGYFLLVKPAALFLVTFAGKIDLPEGVVALNIENMLRIQDVADFISLMMLGCGVAFELPVVLSVLGWLGIISATGMWKFNKYALVLAALLGGILTPGGDVVSQLLLAGPVFVLYNLSIIVVFLIERGRKKNQAELEKQLE
ncbi:MAG: twin-arginine translocase subunit TatC [Deltaproteobacteria bacterium]|mgnify:CR=1 FL=1|nr:twin-arginine translocase subunit TatC [Deltaproteobacteria bacterium]